MKVLGTVWADKDTSPLVRSTLLIIHLREIEEELLRIFVFPILSHLMEKNATAQQHMNGKSHIVDEQRSLYFVESSQERGEKFLSDPNRNEVSFLRLLRGLLDAGALLLLIVFVIHFLCVIFDNKITFR